VLSQHDALVGGPSPILAVALLNTRFRLIKFEAISQGIVNEALAHPREILKPAIIHSAFAFVLMHNHPSGGPLDFRAKSAGLSLRVL
jgi:DNA repair protein RadC